MCDDIYRIQFFFNIYEDWGTFKSDLADSIINNFPANSRLGIVQYTTDIEPLFNLQDGKSVYEMADIIRSMTQLCKKQRKEAVPKIPVDNIAKKKKLYNILKNFFSDLQRYFGEQRENPHFLFQTPCLVPRPKVCSRDNLKCSK